MSDAFSIEGDNKVAAIVSYLTIIGLVAGLILYQQNRTDFAAHHLSQAIGLLICSVVLSFVASIPILGWIVAFFAGLALFAMWVFGLLYAVRGQKKTVPILGDQFAEWFSI